MVTRPTASIIIIGDEILKGQTKDTNSNFLCQELYKCGVKVSSVTVIPDDIEVISKQVLLHSNKHSYVLTSGGIGPTHDDVTYEGIAKAFGEKLVQKEELKKALESLCYSIGLDKMTADKMSNVPESAQIHHARNSKNAFSIPIISIKNVFIFPGIPSYLECSFYHLKSLFCSNTSPYYHRELYVDTNEFAIAHILSRAVKEYEGIVKFGSYPEIQSECYQVKLTLQADCKHSLVEAEAFLRSFLTHNCIVSQLSPMSVEALKLLLDIYDEKSQNYIQDLSKSVKDSILVLEDGLKRYSPHSICLSFNGGKDCTALLHLTSLVLAKKYGPSIPKLKVLYVHCKQPFPEIEVFIKFSVERYNLDLITYHPPIKDALLKLQSDHPEIKAIIIGSRHTDPHCSHIDTFQMTDSDWPQYMRISPLLHWSYPQVWKFLRCLDVPYCSLYDKGYTSLGSQNNTVPNEKLLSSTKNGEIFYLPAYLLKEHDQEREGRASTIS